MNIPIEIVAPVATVLVGAIGVLARSHLKRSADCDTRVAALEARVDAIQEKRIAELQPVVRALQDGADANEKLVLELQAHRDWSTRAISQARDEIIQAIRAAK